MADAQSLQTLLADVGCVGVGVSAVGAGYPTRGPHGKGEPRLWHASSTVAASRALQYLYVPASSLGMHARKTSGTVIFLVRR